VSALEWVAQGALLLLLLALLPLAWRLERRIATLRAEGAALAGGAQGMEEATQAAEAALSRLRATAETSGRQMAERVATAEKLRDDLAWLTERAEVLADRLEGLVRSARPLAGAGPEPAAPAPAAAAPMAAAGASAAAPRSEAERELLRALRGLR
jgi:septal ring factor EnvC (AmiA/AmiB activator)